MSKTQSSEDPSKEAQGTVYLQQTATETLASYKFYRIIQALDVVPTSFQSIFRYIPPLG